ncbi:Protein sum2 [Psilocybe cubensis]|uniref:Scd6-like Sm domain-containing protein n=2 Tax=Psilocybe cubensis TaxID=181762 RepID=A0A8H8CNG7_PSICU|nr:Protein sum2 [Psilocybe cubensis]KAH9484490.1 Protein sum2 [Psilocybe cubensis]
MALSFIGKPISLISHSDVRYRGILAGIDPQASTIQLSNVYSMGTEGRRPPNQFIAPVQDPYAYIIFRASEVKDLSVDEPSAAAAAPPQHNVHDDPAVLGAGGPAPKPYAPYPNPQLPANGAPSQQPQPPYNASQQGQPALAPVPQQNQPAPTQTGQAPTSRPAQQNANTRRPNPVHTAAASLETVERALGDLRVSGGGAPNHSAPRGGRRGGQRAGGGGRIEGELKVPKTDFDFQSSNAKFEKPAHSPAGTKANTEDGNADGSEADAGDKAPEKEEPAYNPQKSFFDSLSSSSAGPASGPGGQGHRGGGGGRRGGPGSGRNRREEEREKNVATFGEPGGVGLLGPGSYVGGWGGYGRRGGRPRRGGGGGGGRGGANGQSAVQARV